MRVDFNEVAACQQDFCTPLVTRHADRQDQRRIHRVLSSVALDVRADHFQVSVFHDDQRGTASADLTTLQQPLPVLESRD